MSGWLGQLISIDLFSERMSYPTSTARWYEVTPSPCVSFLRRRETRLAQVISTHETRYAVL